MEVISTPLEGCFVIKTKLFGDNRGFFMESFNKEKFEKVGIPFDVKQINFAKSDKNVLRGLHYQAKPFGQSKLVGVINGSVVDIVVDLRKTSSTFGQSFKLIIDSQDTFLLIPKGFAHGYYTLADETVFYYAVDNFYSPEHEKGINYLDKELGLDWGYNQEPVVSEKDQNQPFLKNIDLHF